MNRLDLEDHGPGCGHATRFRSLSGRVDCEMCARLRLGWGECPECWQIEPLHVYEDPEFGPIEPNYRVCGDCQQFADSGGDFNAIEIAI